MRKRKVLGVTPNILKAIELLDDSITLMDDITELVTSDAPAKLEGVLVLRVDKLFTPVQEYLKEYINDRITTGEGLEYAPKE